MKKMLKSIKGFTLVELMVVILIVGVLAAMSIPIYTNYVAQAKSAEGKALVQSVASFGRVYFGQTGDLSGFTTAVGYTQVNPSGNSLFTSYTISGQSATGFTVSTTSNDGSNIKVTLVHDQTVTPNDSITTDPAGL
jgi:prepilin-type N-terminal cleavage/methylation domain-containing protein